VQAGVARVGAGEAAAAAAGAAAAAAGASIEDRLGRAGLPMLPRTAWLEIDLDALVANLEALTKLTGGVPAYPVVKADAYGHGAVPIARALASAGVAGFCVATFDEALQLREAGIREPVLVLYPIPAVHARAAAAQRIAVTAGDWELLEALIAEVGTRPPAPDLEVQLEVETGLGRGGFGPSDVGRAADLLRATPGLRLVGAWTHLQAAEDRERTDIQVARFDEAAAALRQAGHELPRHLAASGGILVGTVASLDGIRPGLAIYGLVPDELLERGPAAIGGGVRLRPVLSLHARPVRVRDLPAGWGIGYGPSFTTSGASRIATLPLGYGDGWPRALSNRASALVRGSRVPLVGNVAMDAVMVDVTDVAGEPVSVRDEFVLLGRQEGDEITAADLARARGTNSWEVVTAMAARLPRVYHARSGPQGIRTLVSDMGPRTGSRRS
jgi:alanine racemase